MSCARVHPLLSSRLDGELAPEQRAAVDEHLRACAVCARAAARLAGTSELFAELRAARAPAGLRARVLGAAPAPRAASPLGSVAPRAAAALVGALLGLGAAAALGTLTPRRGAPVLEVAAPGATPEHARLVARRLGDAARFFAGGAPAEIAAALDDPPEARLLARLLDDPENR